MINPFARRVVFGLTLIPMMQMQAFCLMVEAQRLLCRDMIDLAGSMQEAAAMRPASVGQRPENQRSESPSYKV